MKPVPLYDAVCFDFDSTLTQLEGIDELAKRAGVEATIAPLTVAAMEGSIPLDRVYGKRLEIVRPGRDDVDWLAQRYIDAIVPGVDETLAALRQAGVSVHIVSGGLRAAILPFAARCAIPDANVHAVDMTFRADASFGDFDRASPLTLPNGKAVVCSTLRKSYPRLALVGDGITDVAARNGGAIVIGFGGVVERAAVRAGANHFVLGSNLTGVLACLFETTTGEGGGPQACGIT